MVELCIDAVARYAVLVALQETGVHDLRGLALIVRPIGGEVRRNVVGFNKVLQGIIEAVFMATPSELNDGAFGFCVFLLNDGTLPLFSFKFGISPFALNDGTAVF